MNIVDLTGKTICILGFGKEGKAMAEALEKHAKGCKITIADQNSELASGHWPLVSGPTAFDNLDSYDVIIRSPGISPHELPTTLQFTSPTQIFLDSIRNSGAIVIGVTGSKGKSTTSSLIHRIIADRREPKADCHLVGNIGNPAIAYIDEAKKEAIFVMEMSSYQLMDLSISPKIAALTSFFPEHLDYHRSLKSYMEAKRHITRFQFASDTVFFNANSSECEEIAEEGEGKKVPVTADDAPVALKETKLIGEHNLTNIALAWKVAESLGIQKEDAIKAIVSFTPLPHRLQSLGVHHGYEWINDSISTTPESAIAALDALGDRVSVMILGGQDRGLDFSGLAKRMKESNVLTVVTLGESGPRIVKALKDASCGTSIVPVTRLEEAVEKAKSQLPTAKSPSPIVLLSPASPSYDQFKNFEERGQQFEKIVNA